MKETLEQIRREALDALAGAADAQALDALRVKYLGKKGELTAVLKQMGKLSNQERPVIGQLANEVRAALEEALETRGRELEAKALEDRLRAEAVDVTIPGKPVKLGHRHPMYIALDELKEIFIGMGFTVLDGPEVELAELNFDRLNAEEGHPSRDWSDTFYFDEDSRVMLRSQTSPMQVRAMDSMPLPIRIIAPGRVYRKDEVDATHSPMFHQVEGMVIDKGVTMADLKGTLNTVVEKLYGKGTKTRFRPHHFPFTEPSCEMDVQCHKCGGVGCPTCKGEGWIELLGAGMIHPRVLEMAGIDPEVYSGWAFGIGLERTAMRRFKIADLRLIFENDVRFLEQF
ncbi:phenylalanine--tRNA ligase subunit alpha [Flavonifractor sp. An10]|uniref:phenylalanine--tRNA ligase subunit alpha n=1 Tax=Flavonifractor sp. An10 TaxID=1965537 RepID=UPI000B3971F2|nr:phenylalanine--tRNA ligase subunit alpha [Flavonifractor sp. An10]OUQ84637.1 phenylalanine--tRNA ligase subunit alpha [Flavonifractor sp. An10]